MKMDITHATVPLDSANHQAAPARQGTEKRAQPALWNTTEFHIYYFLFALSILSMLWTTTGFSSPSHPNYSRYSAWLRPGWLGRPIDVSDMQYRQFRQGLIPLIIVSLVYLIGRRLFDWATSRFDSTQTTSTRKLHYYVLPFALVFVFALHGLSALKVLFLIWVNYRLAQSFAGRPIWGQAICWSFNVGILICNKHFDGYQTLKLLPLLRPLEPSFKGLIPRWQILFNISILRMISYFVDLHALRLKDQTPRGPPTPGDLAAADFSLPSYLAYVLYPPLYTAGPIMTFTAFITQTKVPPSTLTTRHITVYAIRFALCLFNMEIMLHYIYVVAIKNAEAWQGFTVNQLLQLGFWNLIVIWFKLLLPWRFFRLWALCDGYDPPENMVRCMGNNYSVSNFWRSWHRSYNIWILKYIYVPMGGSQNAFRATLVVFTFVALWHDISWSLLAWGWAVTLFLLPEMIARRIWPAEMHAGKTWYRQLSALGGVGNIVLLILANLLGFALGSEGTLFLVQQAVGTWSGLLAFLSSCGALFVWTQIMFEYREEELRKGIQRRC